MTCHIVCTCAVSPLCEWGSASSKHYSEQMTYYTLGNCTSWPHCGSACAGKGCSCLKMSSDTRHKINFQPSSKITSYPPRVSTPTDIYHKKLKYRSKHHFPFQLQLSKIEIEEDRPLEIFVWLDVTGFRLSAVVSQVPERDVKECSFCDRYHILITLGVWNIDQKSRIHRQGCFGNIPKNTAQCNAIPRMLSHIVHILDFSTCFLGYCPVQANMMVGT